MEVSLSLPAMRLSLAAALGVLLPSIYLSHAAPQEQKPLIIGEPGAAGERDDLAETTKPSKLHGRFLHFTGTHLAT